MWYTVEIRTNRPQPKSIIELKTHVRKVIAFDIDLNNPLEEGVYFDVIYQGSGLYGKEVFEIGPNQTRTYELMFSPLKVFTE